MQERNVISGASATIFSSFVEGWESLVVWLIVAFVLILADLKFGVQAAWKRGEKIRGSRVIRRTVNKMVDYICWISIAWVLGNSFGRVFDIPLLAAIVMLVVCSIEISSIFDNYFEYKGLNKRFNVWKFFAKVFKISAIEESIEDKTTDENNK
jgi:tetrahydromethanopterin S-methyltransferase subunit E